MADWRFSAIVALVLFMAPIGGLAAADLTGRQILDEVSARQNRDYESEVARMTLYAGGSVSETRELRRFTRKIDANETRYLLAFTSPKGVRGVALLTWQHKTGDDDQWLYLPAEGDKIKRIAKGGRRTSFMGTDYTYEDIISDSRDKFSYERRPDETLDSTPHFVVDATPTDPDLAHETGYKFRRLYIRQDIYFITRIDYYDRRGKFFKRQTFTNLVKIGDNAWRSNTARMENMDEKTATVIESLERHFDESGVAERMFTPRYLTAQEHMK